MKTQSGGQGVKAGAKKGGGRSPSYPAFGLTRAIKLACDFFVQNERAVVSREAAAQAIGYPTLSGSALQALSTMRQYRLFDKSGKKLGLSADALLICLEPGSQAGLSAIERASTSPKAFLELRREYPESIPNDDALRSHLIREKGFGVSAAKKLIASFRDTLRLVNQATDGQDGKLMGGANDENPPPNDAGYSVGDRVQWESQGVFQFKEPLPITEIVEHEGKKFVLVEGRKGGIPLEDVRRPAASKTTEQKAETMELAKPSRNPAHALDSGLREIQLPLIGGSAILQVPENMGQKNYDMLLKALEIFKVAIVGEESEKVGD